MKGFNPKHRADQYQEIRTEFFKSNDDKKDECMDLIKKSTFNLEISPDQMWSRIWNKPLFANTKVEQARKNIELLKNTPLEIDFRKISSDAWKIRWNRNSNFKWNQNGAYELLGDEIKSFFDKTHPEFSSFNSSKRKIAKWRIYRIVAAGSRLLKLASTTNKPMKKIIENADAKIPSYEKLHGIFNDLFGLGTITTDHVLTDLGLSIKPDIWLTRAAANWGWFEPILPKRSSKEAVMKFFNRRKNVYILIEKVKSILPYIAPLDGCEKPTLREVEYVMMQSQKAGIKWENLES